MSLRKISKSDQLEALQVDDGRVLHYYRNWPKTKMVGF